MSTNSRKQTGKKKKTSAKKSRQQTKTEDFSSFHTELIIWLTVALAALLILGNFGLCGRFGNVFSSVFFGTFGIIQYVVPIVILLLTGLLMANHFSSLAVKKSLLVILFCCMIAAISQMIVDFDCKSVFEAAGYSFESHTGGGAVGGVICLFLRTIFGKAGAILIVFLLSMISLMLIFEKSVLKLLKEFGVNTAKASKERKIRRQEEKQVKEIERKEREKEAKQEALYDNLLMEEPKKTTSKRKKKMIDIGEKYGLDTEFETVGDSGKFSPKEKKDEQEQLKKEAEDFVMPPVTGISDSLTELWPIQTKKEEDPIGPESVPDSFEAVKEENLESGTSQAVMEEEQKDGQPKVHKENLKSNRKPFDETVAKKMQDDMDCAATEEEIPYTFPPMDLLLPGENGNSAKQQKALRETAMKLQQTLDSFGVNVTITNVSCGPSVTRYELQPEQGVKVSKILGLADDIKLNLAAADIRIEAPIPGKAAIGIEVPNKHNVIVKFRDVIDNKKFQQFPSNLAFAVGKDIGGKIIISDLAKMPHLLIAGATGSGKSVCINTLIMSILYKANPADVKFIMIDPKVVELSVYNGIPHLLIPVVTDPQKAAGALNWAVAEMTERYQKFADYNVRNLQGYNKKVEEVLKTGEVSKEECKKMPQIVIIVDELADLMMVAPGEVENAIVRLSQLARAAGIHLVIATQRPSVNVITGLIKANVPSRIAFAVSSGVDSRTIIDMNGAEKLLGKGDMLFYPQGQQKPSRMQGAFITDKEVSDVVEFLKEQEPEKTEKETSEREEVASQIENNIRSLAVSDDRDEYFAEAAKFIVTKEKASIGMIQRMFKVGFNRASRIMEQLSDAGIVGPEEGTKPRKILMSEEQLEQYLEEYM